MPNNEPRTPQLDYSDHPTRDIYHDLHRIYDSFNYRLFDDTLPNCLLTLQRQHKSHACFTAGRFQRECGKTSDEIAFNPSCFDDIRPIDLLAAFAREMVHAWQFYFGTPGRGRYHNREWSAKMKAIGLRPSQLKGLPGRETGDKVGHEIIPGGPFERAATEILNSDYRLIWRKPLPTSDNHASQTKRKSGKRVKYQCPVCGLNAWAKAGAKLECALHKSAMPAVKPDAD